MNKKIKKTAAALGLLLIFSFMFGVLAVGCEQSLHKDITTQQEIKALIEATGVVFVSILIIAAIGYVAAICAKTITHD